ncbi:MAG: alpha/beta fold hydrolase [Planctomycetota bacterium]|nr:alpha/beta fold hydrolase [Planctomycetota bacterium]MDA1162874.1 alpha/beta fold hydrolase [Planctomycetota bacterium]
MAAANQFAIDHGFAEEYPFESHFLEVDGQNIHYIDEGAGETLLCVHGNPTWSFAWRKIVRQLSDRYRVIAVDHLGCGLSSKPHGHRYSLAGHISNLQSLVTQLNLEQTTLFAHDWGGAIGMGTAAKMPERFSRFVLFNTAAFRSQRIPLRIAVCRIPFLGTFALQGLNAFSRAALVMAAEKSERMTAAVKRGYLAPYNSWANRAAVNAFVKDIPLRPSHPSWQTLVEVEAGLEQFKSHPVLLVWGERDWCFTTKFLEEFEQRFPAAQTLRIPDGGHYVFDDSHEVFLPRVESFLSGHPVT